MDVVWFLLSVGLFGIGVGGFFECGCLVGYSFYNSFVEMVIDFGWLVGLIFGVFVFMVWCLVIVFLGMLLDYCFGVCMIIMVVLLSLVYGSFMYDFVLLLMFGFVV